MSKSDKLINRREFLRSTAGITLAAATGLHLDAWAEDKPAAKTRVVLVRDAKALDDKGKINGKILNRMLDEAVTTLFETKDAATAWRKLIDPKDIVGIKSNAWQPLGTPPELEQILKQRVESVGVPAKSISIGDRGILKDPVFQKATVLINVRPLRTHHWSGVGGCIKNYVQFVPAPWDYHDEYCTPLASIWDLPLVKGKTRLNILVLLQPLFYGIGPHHYDRSYVWNYSGMLVGTDPVALDTIGVQLLMAKRREHFKEERPLTPPAIHIPRAETKYGLGISDLDRIELLKRGWKEGALI
ncbi:DUF362 domain-containing protein [Candidatus Zixiibacteriota bacterium]